MTPPYNATSFKSFIDIKLNNDKDVNKDLMIYAEVKIKSDRAAIGCARLAYTPTSASISRSDALLNASVTATRKSSFVRK